MHKLLSLLSWSAVLMALVAVCVASASAQEPGLVGSWQTKDSELVMRVTFNPDGTGLLDNVAIKYVARGDKLMVNEEGTINNYTFKLNGDLLVVSGGNLESPLTFVRQNNAKGFGKRRTAAEGEQGEAKPKEQGIVGRWQSSEATVQINDDGTLNLNGGTYRYAIKGNNITLSNNEGALTFPFKLSGDTLHVLVDGRLVIYRRLTGGAGVENMGSASGTNPQESDSGSWSVTGSTLTAHSRARGTITFSFEKRNHPKTGDPMILLDGDAF